MWELHDAGTVEAAATMGLKCSQPEQPQGHRRDNINVMNTSSGEDMVCDLENAYNNRCPAGNHSSPMADGNCKPGSATSIFGFSDSDLGLTNERDATVDYGIEIKISSTTSGETLCRTLTERLC